MSLVCEIHSKKKPQYVLESLKDIEGKVYVIGNILIPKSRLQNFKIMQEQIDLSYYLDKCRQELV